MTLSQYHIVRECPECCGNGDSGDETGNSCVYCKNGIQTRPLKVEDMEFKMRTVSFSIERPMQVKTWDIKQSLKTEGYKIRRKDEDNKTHK